LEFNWRKWLLRLWLVLSVGWAIFVLASNYNNLTRQIIVAPDNATIIYSISCLNANLNADNNQACPDNSIQSNKGSLTGANKLNITYDPLAQYIELHGYSGIAGLQSGANNRIALPTKYRQVDEKGTTKDIITAFIELEKERKVNLINKVIVNIFWPVLFSAIIFYMVAWIIFGLKQSKRT
jgi:phage shock protein PspC (stress-responsive transcriptional regulator)